MEFLGKLCDQRGIPFFSVDVRGEPFSNIRRENFYSMTGERFLTEVFPSLGFRVAAAYLDNFDWIWEPDNFDALPETDFQRIQTSEYAERGYVLNNLNSGITHLRQTELILPFTDVGSMICYDDTWFDSHREMFNGKGGPSLYYALSKGWKLVSPMHHDVMFVDNNRKLAREIGSKNYMLIERSQ